MSALRSGADALCEELERARVGCVFGLPGTQTVGVYESLRRSGLRVIVPSHELAAAFMAGGYARATGRPAVLLTIPGPGFAYALAGLAESTLDAVPVVHITLSPAVGPTGTPAFQALDQAAIIRPLVKATFEVRNRGALRGAVREALRTAAEPDPGPVYLELAEAVLLEQIADADRAASSAPESSAADLAGLTAAVEAIAAARRPVLFMAADCATASAELAALGETCRLPVCVPPPSRGVIAEDHPWSLCFDDQRTRADLLNTFLAESDCIVVLGSRLGHVSTAGFRLLLPKEKVVCVTASGSGLPHGYASRALTRAEPVDLIRRLLAWNGARRSEWTAAEIGAWQERFAHSVPSELPEPSIEGGAAAKFFGELRAALPRDVTLVTDSGLHQMLARRYFPVLTPRGLMFPSELQSMGFGLPTAMGATLADPGRPVVAIVGDGGMLMSGLDLLTASRDSIATIVVVFNDGQLNLIRLQQLREFGHTHGVELTGPDFRALAASLGATYRRVGGDVRGAVLDALGARGPVLLDVQVGDSYSIHRLRATSAARETVRGALGPGLVSWIKRRLR